MGLQSAHVLRIPGISSGKRPPDLIYHQRERSNEFWGRAAARTSFLAMRGADFRASVLAKLANTVET
jgi:hypothetical protein